MPQTVLSGNRPTGRLHLGHLHGALSNWIALQEKYRCFYFVADWHALTTKFSDVSRLSSDTEDMVIDWLAAGLDPERATIYRQSDVSQVAELQIYFSMITPLGWLERSPAYKEMIQEIGPDIATHGFLGYPVLQAADILIVQGEFVPVGEDQLSHVELTREIARRFNHLYGSYFVEPKALLTKAKRVPGIDGRKMSKSYGNAIYLSDPPEEIVGKVRRMITDPGRAKRTDPGNPEICSVFTLHQTYSPGETEKIADECREAARGCTECKLALGEAIAASLADFRERRAELEGRPKLAWEILDAGAQTVRPIAAKAIRDVRRSLNIERPGSGSGA